MERTTENFRNEPLSDFTVPALRSQMAEALKRVEADFGKEWPLVIGGRRVETGERIASRNPAKPEEVVGLVAKAGKAEVAEAMKAATAAFETWSRVSARERAELLFRAADIMRRRKMELSATMVVEVGKSWVEADADTAEAIDFLDFYGREALRYAETQPITPLPGEKNELFYIPLGVGVIIPPWNFPLAILTGMTTGAVVAGNTVILKPASESPVIAARFMSVMEEAGLPAGVINFLPGSGAVVGDPLVDDARTRFIAFTGSMEVGLRIVERAAKTQPGQKWIKRVVAEMGGKDAIIVDNETDLEEAARGVLASAYGYSGQKCSACSRAIVVGSVYEAFLQKLIPMVKAIKVGDPRNPEVYLGPVVNQASRDKTLEYIEIGKKEGRLVAGGERIPGEGWFVTPTVIADVKSSARIAQEEIFAPVLAVLPAADFDDALRIANDSLYGLTGAVYSRNREKLDKARREFFAGNLYLNRKCTGAMVGGHPFGGFNMSGTDSKAGGRDYLLLFMQAKAVSEKVA